ncbi:hypothetical protein FRB94_000215 [Tulasnella sp. JGI-2019a]|nr:hypothetical protein FRB94_000215 [Tulasnella sp. JGI-2019a]KAG9015327.1 hypothetical protein FRB93_013027 [Tulasnella sp. JGI-2019a]
MGKEPRATPRVVSVAIPIFRAGGKILLVTSRKRSDKWVLPKGGWEPIDVTLEAAACREALEEAGVRGTISRFVVTIPLPNTIYHVYEMEVTTVEDDWLERKERTREWMDFSEAARRLAWKPELLQGLMLSTLAPKR